MWWPSILKYRVVFLSLLHIDILLQRLGKKSTPLQRRWVCLSLLLNPSFYLVIDVASDPAQNPYWKRDVRRIYPQLSVVAQSELSSLLIEHARCVHCFHHIRLLTILLEEYPHLHKKQPYWPHRIKCSIFPKR